MLKQSLLSSEFFIFICLCLSVFRIYLEIVGFDFKRLPLTKKLDRKALGIHRYGFYMSVGYFVLFAPSYFLS
ncbi:MAG: hypothetical protein HON90_09580 [Halobacteriovoraceae bacterium]|jgi:hypothetical protein|nr:hypothetical protein [Halobacteriovoraceae bacterium]